MCEFREWYIDIICTLESIKVQIYRTVRKLICCTSSVSLGDYLFHKYIRDQILLKSRVNKLYFCFLNGLLVNMWLLKTTKCTAINTK